MASHTSGVQRGGQGGGTRSVRMPDSARGNRGAGNVQDEGAGCLAAKRGWHSTSMREGLQWKWLAEKTLYAVGDFLKGRNCQAPLWLLPDIATESPTARRRKN